MRARSLLIDELATHMVFCVASALVTKLNAAETFNLDRLQSDLISPVWKKAGFYFIEGFFFTVTPEGIMHLAKHSHDNNKTFAMGLSAPFICQFFSKPLLAVPALVLILVVA